MGSAKVGHRPELVALVIRLYVDEGLTLQAIGQQLGLSPSTVRGILVKARVPSRAPGRPAGAPQLKQRNEEIVRLCLEEGLSLKEVAGKFDLSLSTVEHILRHAGLGGTRSTGWHYVMRHKEDMIRAYQQDGLTPEDIGARFHLSPRWVRDVLRGAGMVVRRSKGPAAPHLEGRNKKIIRLYLEGLTLREVGIRFGLSHERVRQIVKRAGIYWRLPIRPRKLPAKETQEPNQEIVRRYMQGVRVEEIQHRNQEIVGLYVQGVKVKEIAARFGTSEGTVHQAVIKSGVPLRRPGMGGRKAGVHVLSREARLERNQEIVRLYRDEGLTLNEIGPRYGLAHPSVIYVLQAAGVERHPGGWRSRWPWKDRAERTREIVDAYVQKGLSIDGIAALFGVNPITVRRVLDAAGVAWRTRTRRQVTP